MTHFLTSFPPKSILGRFVVGRPKTIFEKKIIFKGKIYLYFYR